MSWKRVAENQVIRNFALQLYTHLYCGRQICTSTSLSSRGIRGVYRSLNLTEEEAMDLTADDLEQLTSSNMDDLKQSASQIESDAAKFQKFIQQKTIGQKYFKKYEPKEENLLTWEMKEQLRYLHATDPDEWTPEVLAAAFPVSVEGAKKLLKARWFPENEAAIEKHDKVVLARWQKHTNGRLGSIKLVEEALKKKLGRGSEKLPVLMVDSEKMMSTLESLQFENYEVPQKKKITPEKKVKPQKTPKLKSGSFVSIIDNYEAQVFQNKDEKQSQPSENKQSPPGHTDAALITSGAPEYEGSYSRISSRALPRQSVRNRRSQNKRKMMTLEEFLLTKSES